MSIDSRVFTPALFLLGIFISCCLARMKSPVFMGFSFVPEGIGWAGVISRIIL